MATRSSSRRAGLTTEVAAAGLVLGYGVVLVCVLPPTAYVPVNLAGGGLAVLAVHGLRVGWRDLGLARDRMLVGLRLGALWLIPIAAGLAATVALPATRSWFLDDSVLAAGTGEMAYHLLIRIPLGTALAEELIFRGALLGLYLQRHRPWVAVAMSSTVFGLWHVASTVGRLHTNQLAAEAGGATQAAIVAAAVLAATAAGAFFSWLRLRTGSLLAPWVAHAGTNMLAVAGVRLAGRLGG
jgi:membrane protease YdiL (CAAX protease family)